MNFDWKTAYPSTRVPVFARNIVSTSHPLAAQAGASGLVVAGLEAAGEVAALGPGVTGLAVGDRVMAMCAGGYAELTTVHHRVAVAIPSSLSFEEAASLPVAVMTGQLLPRPVVE